MKSKYDKEIKILKFPRKYKLYRKTLITITDVWMFQFYFISRKIFIYKLLKIIGDKDVNMVFSDYTPTEVATFKEEKMLYRKIIVTFEIS